MPTSRPRKSARLRKVEPLLWLGPALLLLFGVVIYPMFEMVRTSFADIGRSGLQRGYLGLENYQELLAHPDLPRIALQSLLWLGSIVLLTLAISWPMALLLNQDFPGRTIVRYAVIVPWAASLVMTSLVFLWMFNYYYGAINAVLGRVGIPAVSWLGSPATAWVALILVGVFVSVPFNTYVLLAGLQAVPEEIYEAAKLDGSGALTTWFHITRPMLKDSVLVAVTLNIVGVFNSFPIIWLITGGGPNRATHTTITFMYELAFRSNSIGPAAALSVFNLVTLLVLIMFYLRSRTKGGESFV